MPKYTTHTFTESNIFRPAQTTPWQRFRRQPLTFFGEWLYTHRSPKTKHFHHENTIKHENAIKVVCISDTHNETPFIPDGDILIHAGDITQNGTFDELRAQLLWLQSLPHPHKILIAGNHDLLLDPSFSNRSFNIEAGKAKSNLEWGSLIYLENTSVTIPVHGRALTIFGSPRTPKQGNWAFQYPRGPEIDVWNSIPSDADIVVTHGPPLGHVDFSPVAHARAGCPHLAAALHKVRPKLFVCGHIHEARGREVVEWDKTTIMYDAAVALEKGVRRGVWLVFGKGLLEWAWDWVKWTLGKPRETVDQTTLVNASIVGHWGIADGIAVEI